MKIKKELLQTYMKKHKITDEVLAKDIGVNLSVIKILLNGEAVDEKTASKFIHYFGADKASKLIDWQAMGKLNPFEGE